MLAQKVPSIKQALQQKFEIISRIYAAAPENGNFDSEPSRYAKQQNKQTFINRFFSVRELGAKASLELGLVHHYYRSVQKAKVNKITYNK